VPCIDVINGTRHYAACFNTFAAVLPLVGAVDLHLALYLERGVTMKNKSAKRFLAIMLAFAMVLTGAAASMISDQAASAAKKKSKKVTLKLSKSSLTLNVRKSKTLKVTKKNVKKVKSTKWTSSKKSVATVSKKGKVTAKKAGKATIKCTVKYTVKGSKKAKSKTLKCKVTVKAAAPAKTSSPTPTKVPTPAPTQKVDYSAIDMSDPMEGVKDVATVTDAEVKEDVTNLGESHKSVGGVDTKDNGMMRKKLTAHQTTGFMGLGWNLANTMESCADGEAATTVDGFEQLWGQPRTTQKMIDGIKASGFKSVRIPVAWSNMMSTDGNYTINADYMKRVETIVNYCLSNELYVVLNIHYDAGWWGMFGSADKDIQAQAWKKYVRIWEQIATRFKEYSDRLIFESANEELGDGVNDSNLGLNTAVNGVKGKLTQDEIYEKVNAINQKFVEVVRKTGGNNAYRQLLIAGFCTDLAKTCDDRYKMPTDTVKANGKEKLHVSIHYYTPGAYCIGEDATSSFYSDSWGTEQQVKEMHDLLDRMAKFTDQGYGVIIGECGPQTMSKKGVIDFYKELANYGMPRHMVPMWWNLSMYDRTNAVVTYSDIADLLKEITGAQNIPLEEGADVTGVPSIELVDESTLEKVAEWNGKWTRTNNKSQNVNGQPVKGDDEVGGFDPGTAGEGMEVRSNAFWWQMFVKYDWTKLTKPCIKVTMASDDVSKDAAFQMGYGEDKGNKDPAFTKVDEYDNATYASKTFTLKPAKLAIKPWVCLTTQTEGASIVKVEIYDVKK